MRLTLEVLGHTLTLALEQDTEPESEPAHGDTFATTERAEALDFDRTPIGFASGANTEEHPCSTPSSLSC